MAGVLRDRSIFKVTRAVSCAVPRLLSSSLAPSLASHPLETAAPVFKDTPSAPVASAQSRVCVELKSAITDWRGPETDSAGLNRG